MSPRPTPYVEVARGVLRDRVLDAVGEQLGERPWAQVTMADVAERAGVSRQTVYNAFGTRAQLAQAYLEREADRFLADVELVVRRYSPEPRQALVSALVTFFEAAAEHQLVRALIATYGNEELVALITTRGEPLISHASARLTGFLAAACDRLDRADLAPAADLLVRVAISHAVLPSGNPTETASRIARAFGPRLDQLLS